MAKIKLGNYQSTFLLLILMGILTWFGLQGLEMKKVSQKNNQINECIKSGSVEYLTPNGTKVIEPSTNWYDKCLKDKGIN